MSKMTVEYLFNNTVLPRQPYFPEILAQEDVQPVQAEIRVRGQV